MIELLRRIVREERYTPRMVNRHGGHRTFEALRRRGLVDARGEPTDKGRAYVAGADELVKRAAAALPFLQHKNLCLANAGAGGEPAACSCGLDTAEPSLREAIRLFMWSREGT